MLVGRIQWHQKWIINNPAAFLGPNYDIQMAIEESIEELSIPYNCHHVRGHQDCRRKPKKETKERQQNCEHMKNCKNKKLKWEATLNIKADDLATAAYNELKENNSQNTFYPISSVKAYFYLNGVPIVKSYREVIIDAWVSQDYREHMEKIFK
eukprot:6890089-Ditylum_brightwellii.AAC.1